MMVNGRVINSETYKKLWMMGAHRELRGEGRGDRR